MVHPRILQTAPNVAVKVWSVQDRRGKRGYLTRPWVVRWKLDRKLFQRNFTTRAEADRFRSSLLVAQSNREPFDLESGQPISWLETSSDIATHVWVRRWLVEEWDGWGPRTRDSNVEAISRFVPLMVRSGAREKAGLRQYLKTALRPDVDEEFLEPEWESWLDRWCLSLSELNKSQMADVELRLCQKLDGSPLAASTASRYVTVSKACLVRAVDLELLESDPWPKTSRGKRRRKTRRKKKVDIRILLGPARMREALAAIETQQPASKRYRVMTSVMYYGGLRPSEVVMLRPQALKLPKSGWGEIDVCEADVSYDESGDPKTGQRFVPIPPVLVKILADWVDEAGYEDGELIFRTRNGNRPTPSNWLRAWHRALRTIGEETQSLYHCRHAAATTWLGAGVPLGETARRLGHSVETLVSTYVGALTGDESAANAMIDRALEESTAG